MAEDEEEEDRCMLAMPVQAAGNSDELDWHMLAEAKRFGAGVKKLVIAIFRFGFAEDKSIQNLKAEI